MTIAPKDDLLIIPQDQIIKVDQPTPETNNSQSSSFTPPAGWGEQSKELNEADNIDSLSSQQTHTPHSKSIYFIKIFLIATALILLGVLLGVLFSAFFDSSTQTGNLKVDAPVPNKDLVVSTPSGSLLPVTSPIIERKSLNKIEYRNNLSGAYSFDLSYSDDWQIATKSTEKNNLNITLNNQDLFVNISYKSKIPQKPKICLLPEEISPKNIPYLRYSLIKEIVANKLSWRLAKDLTATQSASYLVCEQNTNNQYLNITNIGYISFGLNNGKEISIPHESKLLKLFENLTIYNNSTSSSSTN